MKSEHIQRHYHYWWFVFLWTYMTRCSLTYKAFSHYSLNFHIHTLVTMYSYSKLDQPWNQNHNVELSLKFPALATRHYQSLRRCWLHAAIHGVYNHWLSQGPNYYLFRYQALRKKHLWFTDDLFLKLNFSTQVKNARVLNPKTMVK